MKIEQQIYDQLCVLTLKGELASEAVDVFKRAAQDRIDQKTRDFVLDCTAVDFIDSKGLETLIWLQEQCGERLGQIRLAALTENVQKILEMTRLATRLDRHPDLDTAIKSLR